MTGYSLNVRVAAAVGLALCAGIAVAAVPGGRQPTWTTVGIAVVAFMAALSAVVWIVHGIRCELLALTSRLAQAAEGTAASAAEATLLVQGLTASATGQAAAAERTSAWMSDLVTVTTTNAESASDASGLVYDVALRVGGSRKALVEMVTAMDGIEASSQQAVRIVNAIDEIAFQTENLALRAAVEAARAGDAGLGFAGVASDVRELAQRAATAAQDAVALIGDAISRAGAGSVAVSRAEESVATVAESIQHLRVLVDEVSAAAGPQARSYEQVTQATALLEQVTQATAAGAEASAAANDRLRAQAAEVMSAVDALGRLIGAARSRTPASGSTRPDPRRDERPRRQAAAA